MQLKRGILGREHRLDDIDLIGETSPHTTQLCFREEADSFSQVDQCLIRQDLKQSSRSMHAHAQEQEASASLRTSRALHTECGTGFRGEN